MARFQWSNGNLGFYGYAGFEAYKVTALADTGMTLSFDTTQGAFNPTVHAASIALYFSGGQSYTVENGPDAGQLRMLAGTLTEMRYLDGAGDILLNITNLALAVPAFLATLQFGDGFAAWTMVTHGANGIFGSGDASGPGYAGTGDVLDTGVAADTVFGYGGDDYIKDEGGADSYSGGSGYDTLAYDAWFFQPQWVQQGIVADLSLGQVTGPDAAVDKIVGIESVVGTFMNDRFAGDRLANRFAGLAGADRIDGRGGFDTASYAGDAAQGGRDGIRVNLGAGTVRDGFGFIDRLISVEGIIGTALRDVFNDAASNSHFDGGAGNDVFFFVGGNDYGHGGAGADTFTYRGTAFDDDTVDDFNQSEGDRVIFDAATAFNQIHMFNVKVANVDAVNVQFGSGSVTLIGWTVAQMHAADFGF